MHTDKKDGPFTMKKFFIVIFTLEINKKEPDP